MTIREALAEGSAALLAAGIESHTLDASLLLAEVFAISRSALVAAGPGPLADESLAAFRRLVQRRLAGENVAYIVGRKEFYGLDFLVNPAVLVPRPDTETLVEAALEFCRNMTPNGAPGALRGCPPQRGEAEDPQSGAGAGGDTSPLIYANQMTPNYVLDLCTGSGAIAIALKHEMPELEIWAADISAAALETAKLNAARLLPPQRYTPIHFRQGDLYEALIPDTHSPFSLITSNAPYIPGGEIESLAPEVRNEPRIALDGGGDGLAIIKKIIDGAPGFLRPGGALLLEADPRQMRRIGEMLAGRGFINIKTRLDLAGRERVIGGEKPQTD